MSSTTLLLVHLPLLPTFEQDGTVDRDADASFASRVLTAAADVDRVVAVVDPRTAEMAELAHGQLCAGVPWGTADVTVRLRPDDIVADATGPLATALAGIGLDDRVLVGGFHAWQCVPLVACHVAGTTDADVTVLAGLCLPAGIPVGVDGGRPPAGVTVDDRDLPADVPAVPVPASLEQLAARLG